MYSEEVPQKDLVEEVRLEFWEHKRNTIKNVVLTKDPLS